MKILKKIKKKQIIVSLGILLFLIIISHFIPVNEKTLFNRVGFSYEIFDRNGVLLRKGLSTNGYFFSKVEYSELPSYLINALIVAEDKNFYFHYGIDIFALFRAFFENIFSKNKSGASTITMQIARNIYTFERNIFSKIFELWLSIRLESSYTKKQLIEIYFNTIPFGKQIIGIKSASRVYFDKNVSSLSPAEASFLIALVKYPAQVYDKSTINKIKIRQKYILLKMLKNKVINQKVYENALKEKIELKRHNFQFKAPHFTDYLISEIKKNYPDDYHKISKIYTTIDMGIQEIAEQKAKYSIGLLRDRNTSNASVIILNNHSAELLAMVGSLNYFIDDVSGQVNGALAERSPGSTLKPFTYASAIERKTATAATIIPDVKTRIRSSIGDFIPENHNRKFHGPITLRLALANSFNIPAARIISEVGVTNVLNDMRKNGFRSLKMDSDHYGTSLALGGGDISLYELTNGYLTFRNEGIYRKPVIIRKVYDISGKDITKKENNPAVRVYSKQTSFIISNILSDNRARELSFTLLSPLNLPFFCASKTGTSKGYRNIWTAGFSKNFTIGVWVGNFDNAPMKGMTGISGAASIFRGIMLAIENDYDYKPDTPENIVELNICKSSGLLLKKECSHSIRELFIKGSEPKEFCDVHFTVPFYKNTDQVVFIDKNQAKTRKNIEFKKITLYSQIYNDWLEENGYKLPSKEIVNYINWLKNEKNRNLGNVQILFPSNGHVFALDPILDIKYQTLNFRALIEADIKSTYWHLNNEVFIVNTPPFSVKWQLKRGQYTLALKVITNTGEEITSKPVKFEVR